MRVVTVLVLLSAWQAAEAIRCKCTKESETVRCSDGVCDIQGGACLMLDHPSMGVHYTCHTKGLNDGTCQTRTTKSGAAVRICGCDSSDFCNYSYWPEKTPRAVNQAEAPSEQTSSAPSAPLLLLLLLLPAGIRQFFL